MLVFLSSEFRSLDSSCKGYLPTSAFKSALRSAAHRRRNCKFSKAEVRWLCKKLKGRSGDRIVYGKLKDVLTDGEVIFDDDDRAGEWASYPHNRWAVKAGSVGEWLHNVATPMDRRNFSEFMELVHNFQTQRGINSTGGQCSNKGNAVVIKLGPMMNAAIKFFVE